MVHLRRVIAILALSVAGASAQVQAPAPLHTKNIILVVTDGLRWQELFGGADSTIVFTDKRRPDWDNRRILTDYWRAGSQARREALLPFTWSVIGRQGQIFGNRNIGSVATVTNGLKFSYPGYNEMLAGAPDPRIDRNEFGINPNVTVFEWLNRQPELKGEVAAFATWDVFADIFARRRSGLPMHVGWETPYARPSNAADSLLNRLYATSIREWDNNAYDVLMHSVMMRYLEARHPRVVFVGYGETDEWAHAGRYDRLLASAHTVDGFLRELWSFVQSDSVYRDRTTMIVTTDHGRGRTDNWTDHGRDVRGAEEWWVAVIGPDTPALGERGAGTNVAQSQIAATVAALLGFDFRRDATQAAAPIGDVIRR
ncbi:MAG TPA: hypothetical protein VFT29_01475 [Gemmatimonadaceae bacterium]|nr:hypothetical protein [Gemmatimonadaceae bacterium]